jgi:hypothetical protein
MMAVRADDIAAAAERAAFVNFLLRWGERES